MDYYIITPIIILFAAGIILFAFLFPKMRITSVESAEKKAGRLGERFAGQIIREIMDENDVLLNNIKVSFEDKNTELDNVIINDRGVFIIEVKNYRGNLFGGEDDAEWMKNEFTSAGNFYHKTVKNPIRQVKRQIYILTGFLNENGVDVNVEGYVFFVEMNSPIKSRYVLNTQRDINQTIHFGTDNNLTQSVKEKIIEIIT